MMWKQYLNLCLNTNVDDLINLMYGAGVYMLVKCGSVHQNKWMGVMPAVMASVMGLYEVKHVEEGHTDVLISMNIAGVCHHFAN